MMFYIDSIIFITGYFFGFVVGNDCHKFTERKMGVFEKKLYKGNNTFVYR